MVNKPDYIQFIEIQEGVFSVMKFPTFDLNVLKYFDEKKYERVYEVGVVSKTGKAKWNEVIFKTKQEFFLHFACDNEEQEEYKLNIYYKADKRNELIFFTTQVLKPFRDGTTDNTTIEGKN